MKKQLWLAASFLAFVAIFAACKKDATNATFADLTTSTQDLATVEDLSEQAEVEGDQAIEERGGGSSTGCPTITFDQPQGTFPNKITIDFGTDGCTRPNGRVLKGKIVIDQSAKMNETGATRTINLIDFFSDDVKVEGSHVVTNTGLNSAGQPVLTKKGSKTLTWPDGTTASWQADHTATMIAGFGTTTFSDDSWSITGGCSGVNRKGKAFTSTILTPLVKNADCKWIVSGSREVTTGDKTRTLDFGSGDCDNLASLTLANGNVIEIKLHK